MMSFGNKNNNHSYTGIWIRIIDSQYVLGKVHHIFERRFGNYKNKGLKTEENTWSKRAMKKKFEKKILQKNLVRT